MIDSEFNFLGVALFSFGSNFKLILEQKNNRYVIYSLKSGGAPYITISVRGKISHGSALDFHYLDEVSKNAKPGEIKKALTSYFWEWLDWEECESSID